MADTAAHLADRVIPVVPARQWVLSLPYALRYRLAYDAGMVTSVLRVFLRAVFADLRRRAREEGIERAQCGAVTFVQRFGSALNCTIHFHTLVLSHSSRSPGKYGALSRSARSGGKVETGSDPT